LETADRRLTGVGVVWQPMERCMSAERPIQEWSETGGLKLMVLM
jgi:hypothetical protein